jgi:predicted TIM-barrel fold metal-dependent hydrolase
MPRPARGRATPARSAPAAFRPGRRHARKFDLDARSGLHLPIPTRIVSNEEFVPPPQTREQAAVDHRLRVLAAREARRLGISRREFLASSGGMAAAFLAMNAVFGPYFDVLAAETTEPAATAERWPKVPFIFDVQTHHVAAGRTPTFPPLLLYRPFGGKMGNPALLDQEAAWPDLYLANYVKEVFLDSDTTLAVLSGLPSRDEAQNVLPPAKMIESRTAINGLADSRRLIAHGLFSPDLGAQDLEAMHQQVEQLKIEAWKGYPGQPLAENGRGWWMDDEQVAYPAYEFSRRVGIRTICVHKGLPLPEWDEEHSSPRDVPKAAADFPDLNFLIYHAGFKSMAAARPALEDDFQKVTDVPWISDLCRMRDANPKLTNVYMELGTTFGMLVITAPRLCAYVLGQMLESFGEDHILWGTDSIWWGSPQWQIAAFRRFQIPDDLRARCGFPALTDAAKEKILGLNAARVYGVDVKAVLKALPSDAVSKLKAAYGALGPSPSHTQYGWVATG